MQGQGTYKYMGNIPYLFLEISAYVHNVSL